MFLPVTSSAVVSIVAAAALFMGHVGPEKLAKPAGLAKGELAFVMTEPRVQEHPAMHVVWVSTKSKLAGGRIAKDVGSLMAKLTPEVMAAVRPLSGPVIIYEGNTGEPDTEFTVKLAVPVAAGTAAPAGFESAELPAYRAYTLVFSGPVSHLGKAYGMAYERLFQDGKFPEGSSREHVLYWEGEESPNNVSVIQIGIQ